MNRDDMFGLVMGATVDLGLQVWGYYPNVIKYYGRRNRSLKDLLRQASSKSRVIVLSVSGDSVRRFMLAAQELGYTNGEYVFLDVQLFPFKGNYWGDHGWYRGDSDDARAKAAYEALLRIGLYESKSPLFDEFSTELKRRAKLEYGFDYGQEKVNFFVGAFHDAVLLYGIALNETLEAGRDPTDGHNVTRVMWDRHFVGESC
ncbi:Atrial natriuretic peptide receptor 3, partial [Lamellibrachia satsuma]